MSDTESISERDFSHEFHFTFSRSSGPGGQHVNKVNTKVELRFNVNDSVLLTSDEKEIILEQLKTKITSEAELVLVSQSERSQSKNREKVIEKFYDLITTALTPVNERKPSRPSRASKEERLKDKKIQSEKKRLRRGDPDIQTDE
jgi:ribosome-associated protein